MTEPPIALAPSIQTKVDRIRCWLNDVGAAKDEITLDTDLIDNRIVTSLQFVELFLFVEELRDAEISDRVRVLERFRTLRSIATHYLSD